MTIEPEISATYFDKSVPSAPLPQGISAAILFLHDIGLAIAIIIAGSQGIYRFAPPLLLWVLIYLLIGLRYVFLFRHLMPIVVANRLIFAFPLACLVSVVWSINPGGSAYAAGQLIVTYLAAIWIGWRFPPRAIMAFVAIALSPLIVLSLINWLTGMFGEVYSPAGGLLGVFGNKNTLGRMSLLVVLACVALLLSDRRRNFAKTTLLLCVVVLAALALHLSKSVTSTLFLMAALGLLYLFSCHRFATVWNAIVFLGGAAVAMAILVAAVLNGFDPVATVLAAFDKSSSLTGRTVVWDIAFNEIRARPWLGIGYHVYWDNGNIGADRLQFVFGSGLLSFHNFILDIWVSLGVSGLVGIALTLSAIGASYLRYYRMFRNVEGAYMISFWVAAVGVASFNPLLHNQHGNMIVLLIALAVSAQSEVRSAKAVIRT